MAKIVLDTITGGYDLSIINNNFDKIEAEFQNKVLYRDNPTGEPNTLVTDVDANGKRIYNLPEPLLDSQAARLQDVQNAIAGGAANLIEFTPYGNIVATNVQAAIQEEIDDLGNTSTGAALIGVDGTTLATFLKDRNSKVVDSITALKAIDKTKFTRVFVTGYYTAGDGGGGSYWFDPSDTTSPDNGGTVIVATDGGRWKLVLLSNVVSVDQFGAKGDNGVTDNTAAFSSCMTWLNSIGGGVALVGNKQYGFGENGTLIIPAKVELSGDRDGPFEGTSLPTSAVWGPTLLIKASAGSFLTLGGAGASCSNLIFFYPNQVAPSAAVPITYPYCIAVQQGGNGAASRKIRRCTIVNAYQGIDIETGRVFVQDCLIGAFANDILIDHAADWVWLVNVHGQVLWDVFAGVAYPSTIDGWVSNNGIFLKTARVDSLQAINIGFFSRHTGHRCDDSVDVTLVPRSGYGRFVNFDMDYCAYGIVATSTNSGSGGFKYTNFELGANTAGQSSIALQPGGTEPPTISIIGGAVRGVWAAGIQHITGLSNGSVFTSQWRGLNPFGSIAAPSVPATGIAVKNPYPFPCRVAISNGTGALSGVAINGAGAGVAQGMYILDVNETITLTYAGGTVAWAWFGQ